MATRISYLPNCYLVSFFLEYCKAFSQPYRELTFFALDWVFPFFWFIDLPKMEGQLGAADRQRGNPISCTDFTIWGGSVYTKILRLSSLWFFDELEVDKRVRRTQANVDVFPNKESSQDYIFKFQEVQDSNQNSRTLFDLIKI